MKKLTLIIVAALFSFAGFAEEADFAPHKGDFMTEIQFNPFSGDQIFSNGGVFQGKVFITDKSVFLFEAGINGINTKENETSLSYEYSDDSFVSAYLGQVQIGAGYQYHFYNYKRIGLYAGFKLQYIYQFAGNKTQENENNWTWDNKGTGNGFGFFVHTGIDFYVYKGLYVGAEISAGFKDILYSHYKIESSTDGTIERQTYRQGGHLFEGGFEVSPLIRLGWKF